MPGCASGRRTWRGSPSRASDPAEPLASAAWSRYSRRHLLLSLMGQRNEGLFEVGADNLKVADVDAPAEEFPQERFGSVAEQADSMILDRQVGDRQSREVRFGQRCRRDKADLLCDHPRLDLQWTSVRDQDPAIDDDNPFGQLVCLFEVVRGQQDRLALLGEVANALQK